MLDRVLPYLADYGITRIADLTYLDRLGLPVHTAYKPMGLSLSSGSGKGLTAVQSRLGAAMEAIEQTYWETTTLTTIHGSRIVSCVSVSECVAVGFTFNGSAYQTLTMVWDGGV